jgi:Ca2+/H+ antiporter
MSESDGSQWGFLAIVGAMSFCCVGLLAIIGGATVTGGAAASATAATGGGIGGIVVTGVVTAIPLLVIGLVLQRRAQ